MQIYKLHQLHQTSVNEVLLLLSGEEKRDKQQHCVNKQNA